MGVDIRKRRNCPSVDCEDCFLGLLLALGLLVTGTFFLAIRLL
jgi:hypothetical protein